MSEPESFLSRWSRLKHESGLEGDGDEKRTPVPVASADVSSPPAFDPASLPPIESIVADSDIRIFLQAGVPADLTCAALRSAWTADPAIRDFIGIAESQWDFNDPAAMPGFGPLGAADYARHLVTQAVASLNSTAEETRESPGIVEQPASAGADPRYSAPVDEVRQVAAASADGSDDADSDSRVTEMAGVESVTQKNASEANFASPTRHSHGGALPK
jgi:Protein of unknown function (DUF3306)